MSGKVSLDWTDLRYAAAVARSGRVLLAARELGVAHTTLYRRLGAMQRELRVKLFDRTPDGTLAPTEAGRELLATADGLDESLARLTRRLQAQSQRLEGEVTVAVSELLGRELTGWARDLRQLHPGLSVRVLVSSRALDLGRGEADLAVRFSGRPPPDLVGQHLADASFAVHASPALAARGLDLAQHEWVVGDGHLHATPQGQWESAHVAPDRVALRTDSIALLIEAIRAGVGVGIAPCALADDGLVPIGPAIAALTLPMWLLAHRDTLRSPRVRAVKQSLLERIGPERSRIGTR
jgi:DNA-binding transcriptional LysR family regulator